MRDIVSPLDGLRSPFGARRGFTPLSLFSSGEVGAWYDPSDFSTMFQDSAGTTPVTAVEQPVGLILDKSKNLAVGAEIVTNGDFSNGSTGWTLEAVWTVSAGAATYTSGSAGNSIYQTVSLQAGKSYRVTFSITARSGSSAVQATASGIESSGDFTSTGNKSCILRPAANRTQILFYASGAGSLTIDNISVKEIAGNHASQSTSASRPVLSARYNLLTYTEALSNAAWIDGNISSGTRTNGSVSVTSVGGYCYIKQLVTMVSGVNYTCSFDVTCNQTISNVPIRVSTNTSGANSTLLSMTAGQVYRVSLGSITGTAFIEIGIDARSAVVPGGSTSTGYTVTFDKVDLRVTNDGIGLPAYQRVVTGTTNDYDTTGFPLYLKLDGVDDSLATSSIDFSSTDKMTVFAGVRKLSDAAAGAIAELSATGATNAGTFTLLAPSSAAANYYFRSRGSSVIPGATVTTYTAPISNVLTGLGDIANDGCVIRINGVQVGSDTADQGAGTFGNYPLYIGRRGGSTLPYNGRLYSLIIRGASSSDTQIASAEKWVNGKTGAY